VPPLRIGTLGTSRIATPALIAPAAIVPEATVTAVAARDKSRAEAFALQHGIPAAYGSYDELLADPDVDAVYNPLPNSLHGPWTLKAIAAGKHVLCEKPFASNAEQAAQVADAAQASALVVMEAMHYRYHPLVRRLRELVTGGELGPVQHIAAWTTFIIADPDDIRYDYDLAGGALMDGGCYAIDCLRMLAGADADAGADAEITVTGALADPWELTADGAAGGAVADRAAGGAVADRAAGGAVADRAMAGRLALPGGVSGWFDSAFTRSGEFRADVHVSCRDGQVWMQNFILAHHGHLLATKQGSVIADEQASGETTYVWQLRAFAAAVAAGSGEVETSAAHAVRTMGVIDDTYRAAGLRLRD
jgi:predicted dehydrogenase